MIHIYTGDGKGKTTAAFGLGIRAAGRGLKVIAVQFLKTGETGELNAVSYIPGFEVKRFESEHGFMNTLTHEKKMRLKNEINTALEFIYECLKNNCCNLLILDEIFGTIFNNLISKDTLKEIISSVPENIELVLTGRNADSDIIDMCDYVSEIKAVKHPYNKGISARLGIEY